MKKENILDTYKNYLFEAELENHNALPEPTPVELDKELENVISKYTESVEEIKLPIKSNRYIKVKIANTSGVLDLISIDNKTGKEKVLRLSIGKALKTLFPTINVVSNPIVQKMITELQQLFTIDSSNKEKNPLEKDGYKITISSNIAKWYRMCYKKSDIESCVTGSEEKLLTGFDNDPNIKIAILKNIKTDEVVGRALLWHHVEDKETGTFNTYLDRTYPSGDTHIKRIYVKWARAMKYWYRTHQGYDDFKNISGEDKKLRFRFTATPKEMKYVPYMDTFKNLYESTEYGNLIGTNYNTKNRNWWGESAGGTRLG